MLEAGCGSLSHISLSDNVYIVGIDVSAKALAQNTTIHERIQADLETCDLGTSEYDLVVCWDVLEHLAAPTKVVQKLFRAVKPGGLVMLGLPNVLSVKGLLAKYTPLSFHLYVHRLVYGHKAGAAPGFEVFPTYLRYSIAPRSLAKIAPRDGCEVEFLATYESGLQRRFREKYGLVGNRWRFVNAVVWALSMGTITAEASDCVLILRRAISTSPPRPSYRTTDNVVLGGVKHEL